MSDMQAKVTKLLHTIAKQRQLQQYEVTVTPISSDGANYSSLLYVATISSQMKTLEVFVKVAAIGTNMREQIPLQIYDIERFFYSDMKKAYRDLEDKYNVPEDKRFNLPEFYGADATPLEEMLVLENLVIKGFVDQDRFQSIDWEYAATAVDELVKLHALSIAFCREYPEMFKTLTNEYIKDWMNEYSMKTFWVGGFQNSLKAIHAEHKDKMVKFLDNFNLATVKKFYEPLRCKVITHGDFRPSNLMHRRRDDGSLEIIVIDHQSIQVGCPVNDLIYLIFLGTDKVFRDEYFDKLVDYYYTQFSAAMKRLNIHPETTYSKEDFDYELKEKLPLGLAIASCILPVVTVQAEDAPKLSTNMDLDFSVQMSSPALVERINGVVEDYVRWGVLKH